MVLILLLFATQVVFDLYARSAVTSVAVEAARSVAGFASGESDTSNAVDAGRQHAVALAEGRARAALGRWGDVTSFSWRFLPLDGPPTTVELEVRFDATAAGFALSRPLALPGLNRFDRTIRVRVERITCPAGSPCHLVAGLP
jgi:hypothetical protein